MTVHAYDSSAQLRPHLDLSFWSAPKEVTAQLGQANFWQDGSTVARQPASERGNLPHHVPAMRGGRALYVRGLRVPG